MNVNDFIKQHEHPEYCYCEAIVYPDGSIECADYGHVNSLIKYTGLPKRVINKIMPYSASPIHWLTEYTKCIPLWENFFIYNSITFEQHETIQKLVNHGILCKEVIGIFTDEYTRCKLFEKVSKCEICINDIPDKPNYKIYIRKQK